MTASLPRGNVLLFALILLAMGFFAFFLPILLLASGDGTPSPNRIYQHFREGGFGMWLTTLAQSAALTGLSVSGILRIRGTRVPGAALFGLPLLPFSVAALAALWSQGRTMAAISEASIDPSLRARILAEGVSETMNLFVYGGTASATAMYMACVAATLSILSVDTSRVAPGPSNLAWLGALGGAFVGFVAAAGVRLGFKLRWSGLDVLVLFGLLGAGLFGALGGRKARFLVGAKQEDDASRAFRTLVLAGLALAASFIFLDRASAAASLRLPLGAIAGESVDPSQRGTILAQMMQERSGYPVVMLVDALGCLLAFGAPALAAAGVARRFSVSAAVAAVTGALVLLLGFAAGSRIDSDLAGLRAPFVKTEQAISSAGIALAQVADSSAAESPGLNGLVLVKKDGSMEVQPAAAPAGGTRPPLELDDDDQADFGSPTIDVAADTAVPFDTLVNKVLPSLKGGLGDHVLLLAAPWERRRLEALGPYAGLVGTDLLAYPVSLRLKLTDPLPPAKRTGPRDHAVAVLPAGDSARLVMLSDGNPPRVLREINEPMPLGDSFKASEDRRSILSSLKNGTAAVGWVVLAPSAGETTGKVLTWISLLRGSSSSSPIPIVLTLDRAAIEQELARAASRGKLALGQVLVNGRPASDAFSKALKDQAPAFEKCARDTSIDLPASLTVRFTVDTDGKTGGVSTKKGANKALAACVIRVVEGLRLPAASKKKDSASAEVELR